MAKQHFSLSSGSRTLSIKQIARLSDEEAADVLTDHRWPGGIQCPRCKGLTPYALTSRAEWKCRQCDHRFSLTSGSIFSGTKLSPHDLVMGFALFAIGSKGISSLRLSHYLNVQYRTALKFSRLVRQAIFLDQQSAVLSGEVEIDGAYFGGHLRHENSVRGGARYRKPYSRYENRRVVVVLRERGGRTLTYVGEKESDALPFISNHIAPGSKVFVDGAQAWGRVAILFATLKINHSNAFAIGDICTNAAESYFSLLRRCALGVHHKISGADLHLYAAETAWRLDTNKQDSGARFFSLMRLCLEEKPAALKIPEAA